MADLSGASWLCGYAAALAALHRLHHMPSLVASVAKGDGLTLAIFEAAGVEDFDMRELRKCIEAPPRVGEEQG